MEPNWRDSDRFSRWCWLMVAQRTANAAYRFVFLMIGLIAPIISYSQDMRLRVIISLAGIVIYYVLASFHIWQEERQKWQGERKRADDLQKKIDEIQGYREDLSATLVTPDGNEVDLFSHSPNHTMKDTIFGCRIRITNSGKKSSENTYVALFFPSLEGRHLWIVPQHSEGWVRSSVTQAVNGRQCVCYEKLLEKPILTGKHQDVPVAISVTLGELPFSVYWQISSKHEVFPKNTENLGEFHFCITQNPGLCVPEATELTS